MTISSGVTESYPTFRLHRALGYSPTMSFDVRYPPSSIWFQNGPLTSSVLSEPATSPPSLYMRLTMKQQHYFPWSINPKATGYGAGTCYVTVADVLREIYSTLQAGVTPAEYAALGKGFLNPAPGKARNAFEQRYKSIKDSTASKQEKKRGMKRVDFLLGDNRFWGLTPLRVEKGEWTFYTSK